MNRKAQIFPQLGIMMFFLFYFCFYFAWLGGYLTDLGQTLIVANGTTGLWAFFIAYMNIWFFIIPALAFLAWMTYT